MTAVTVRVTKLVFIIIYRNDLISQNGSQIEFKTIRHHRVSRRTRQGLCSETSLARFNLFLQCCCKFELKCPGAKVCISDINESLGGDTVSELSAQFGEDRVAFVVCDVTREESVSNLISQAEILLKSKLYCFINNAGPPTLLMCYNIYTFLNF